MFRLVFLAFLAVLAVGLQPASAQPRRAPGVQPLDRVLPQVRSRYPGTFYDADGPFNDEDGNPHYRLKWMTPEGRVIWLDTDARTGRVLGVEHNRTRGDYPKPPPDMRAPPPPPGYFEGPPRGGDEGGDPDRGRGDWQRGGNGWSGGQGGRGGDHHDGHDGGRGHHGG
ncbi:MAG TPA: hypothetical protein VID67_09990 [Rhizomicrobium sp.]|jgi:hypothetical protein